MGILDAALVRAVAHAAAAAAAADTATRLRYRRLTDAQVRAALLTAMAEFRAARHEAQRRGLWDAWTHSGPPTVTPPKDGG